jgi:hypothetical protein
MYMVNTYRWDYGMVAALVAPRPLLICNTDKDNIFPLDGVGRIHARARDFYDFYKAPEKLGVAITEGGHVDTQELQMPVMRWFNKWLKGSDAPVVNHAVKYFTAEQLRVFQTLPKDEITSRCYESFTTLARDDGPFDPQAALASLKLRTFGAWPVNGKRNQPADSLDGTNEGSPAYKTLASQTASQMRLTTYKFESQPAAYLRLYVLEPVGKKVQTVEFVLADDPLYRDLMGKLAESFAEVLPEERARFIDGQAKGLGGGEAWLNGFHERGVALVVFSPRCIGFTSLGGDKKYQTQIRRRFMLLGMTVASSQVWDTIRALETVRELEAFRASPIHLIAANGLCEVAKFTVLFGPKLESCHIPNSFRDDLHAPDFLNWSRIVTPKQLEALVNSKMDH